MASYFLSVKNFIKKLKKSKEDNKANEDIIPLTLSTTIELQEITRDNFYDLEPGDIVLHKNIKLYKIIGFGKVQISDQWLDTINYKEVFKTTDDQIFSRTKSDFIKSFKKVTLLDSLEIKVKNKKENKGE